MCSLLDQALVGEGMLQMNTGWQAGRGSMGGETEHITTRTEKGPLPTGMNETHPVLSI